MDKLLITGAVGDWTEYDKLSQSLGFYLVFMKNENEQLPINPKEIVGVICNALFVHHDISEFTNLKFIQLTGVGFDRVQLDYINKNDIKLYNAGNTYCFPMAEHVIWGVLSILKNARYFEDKKRNKLWEKNRKVLELHEKTVTIIGCGNVGKECAKLFKGFSCTIIGVDCKEINDDVFDKIYNVNNIEMAIKSADVVVICVPLSSETKRMFNKNMFSLMKDGSVFVNVSRGEIVEEKSLISALDDKLLGAVVDVFETEPLDTQSQLWEKENVILTPHNSFVGDGNSRRLYKVIESNLRDYKCQ